LCQQQLVTAADPLRGHRLGWHRTSDPPDISLLTTRGRWAAQKSPPCEVRRIERQRRCENQGAGDESVVADGTSSGDSPQPLQVQKPMPGHLQPRKQLLFLSKGGMYRIPGCARPPQTSTHNPPRPQKHRHPNPRSLYRQTIVHLRTPQRLESFRPRTTPPRPPSGQVRAAIPLYSLVAQHLEPGRPLLLFHRLGARRLVEHAAYRHQAPPARHAGDGLRPRASAHAHIDGRRR